MPFETAADALATEALIEAIRRALITIADDKVTYRLHTPKSYNWNDPEEWVRAFCIAWLVIEQDYPANRIKTEVTVPRRTPSDFADIVVYRDDACRTPYLIIENKSSGQTEPVRAQAIEQAFGNANSLRAALTLYDEGDPSVLYNVADFPSTERHSNRLGTRTALPKQYGDIPEYTLIAGGETDITAENTAVVGQKIRRAHFIIWAGGRRDPLLAFDEWSKLLFAKVMDERTTPTGQPRRFQVGTNETIAAVANRIHALFQEGNRSDPSIFPPDARLQLSDSKVTDVVRTLQSLSFTHTNVDTIGHAFEEFFGSIFRGELGQYFTMRQLARFAVAMLEIAPTDYVLDPAAGSGGFLLETLLQTWHGIDAAYRGQDQSLQERLKTDFALAHVFGIEIHEILARICKINLLLHHDGHANIEADRSCLDSTFSKPRLNQPTPFSCIVGNPPFGDEVEENDEDHLGSNHLANFEIAGGRTKIQSEQVIIERCITFLEPDGRFGLVVPDGLLNNQGEISNCPQSRTFIAAHGNIEAIISLPDHAFRKSGAQNKTSILLFRKFSRQEKRSFDRAYRTLGAELVATAATEGRTLDPNDLNSETRASLTCAAIQRAGLNYPVFLAEANHVGYTPSGLPSDRNDLYRSSAETLLADDQTGTILGEWRRFRTDPSTYDGTRQPDCMSADFDTIWTAHASHRLDPKYHLFEREAQRAVPVGWVRERIGNLLRRRDAPVATFTPDEEYNVLTISQTGDLRLREAGKGNNPPSWLGYYFSEVSPGEWYATNTDDVVFSGIDLWKGCIAVVPERFQGSLSVQRIPDLRDN